MRDDRQQNLDKFQLSLYLMPFVGAIWAGIKLSKQSSSLDAQERKTSRLSLRIGLIWLIAYSSLWLGGSITSDLWAVRFLYLNTIVTSLYFIVCFLFLSRLWNKNWHKRKP